MLRLEVISPQQYKRYTEGFEEAFEQTSTHYAPWNVVPATNEGYCLIEFLETICKALAVSVASRRRGRRPSTERVETWERYRVLETQPVVLKKIDMSQEMSRDEYRLELKKQQLRIRERKLEMFSRRMPVVVAYEGWDTAGKGGNIKRVTKSLDPRGHSVIPISVPRGEEKAHHYLWRF